MKVAVCLSGQTRTINECIDSLVEHIIAPLGADVFFHFWSESFVNPYLYSKWYRLKQEPQWPDFADEVALNAFTKLKPKKFIVQPQIDFDTSYYQSNCTVANSRMQAVSFIHVLSMYYSIKMANECKRYWEETHGFKYDCVIRCRPDAYFTRPLDEDILWHLDSIHIPVENGYGGLNDQFAISSSSNMDQYSKCYEFVPIHFDCGGNYHPETFLKFHLANENLKVEHFPMNYILKR